ncbi:MAG: DUF6768 family protein, partial [Halocynthiibacter sp.]
MTKLDQMIEQALPDEDHAILKATREQGWFALGRSQFSGKHGWVTWVIVLTQTAALVAGIWFAVKFFSGTEVLPTLKSGLTSAVLILISTQLKMSLMPKMQADRVLRELKRIEL